MFNPILFAIFGLVAFWLLAAIFEEIGFTKHRYLARGLAALLTIIGLCIGGGFRYWWQALIVIGAAFFCLQVLRKSPEQSGQ